MRLLRFHLFAVILCVCGLPTAPAVWGQAPASGSTGMSAPPAGGDVSPPPASPGSAATTQSTSPGSAMGTGSSAGSDSAPAPANSPASPPTISSPPLSPPITAAPPNAYGAAPVSPPVPLLGSPLPPLAPAAVPPMGQATLPALPPASLAAQTPGARPLLLTADDAVVLAARHNLGLMAALQEAFAARSGVQSARVLAPPAFTIGPAFQTGGTTDGLLFLQPLEINGTRSARTGVARAQLRLAQAQALLGLQSLAYTARLLYYALAQAQANLALQQSLLASVRQFDLIARTQVRLGARPGIEAIQTAIEAARARQIVAQASGEEQAARAALNAYLGRAPLDPIDTSRALAFPAQATPLADIAAAQQAALQGRAEVAVARASRDVPQAQESLYRAQGRPDISPSFRISQITPTYMDAGVGVVISVPIDYGTRRNLIRQQQQTAQAQGDRLAGARALVRLDAEQAVVRLQAARTVLAEYDAGLLANAHAVLASAVAGYKAGGTTVIAVLDAQRTYRQILSEHLAAQTDAAQAQAALSRAVGLVPSSLLAQLNAALSSRPAPRNTPHP